MTIVRIFHTIVARRGPEVCPGPYPRAGSEWDLNNRSGGPDLEPLGFLNVTKSEEKKKNHTRSSPLFY